ncbi:hypothetical protein LO763_10490 [Glycomyces sp. A-F 0318]|uniref:hypothetical protein n=1 Tax=Glycomyces amatae TaxID=2881355 RepID=UPI001E51570C|nr:hypothetical protein [Glycomyces amatae]MCD0444051.1 hypothetical protein [Glycomyces amatae]
MTAYQPIDFAQLKEDYGDIPEMIRDLRDPFIEMFQREKALAMWPDYAFVIRLTKDQVFAQKNSGPGSEYPGPRSRRHREYPSRPSGILPFYVPEDASAADEQAIDDAARTDAGTAVTAVDLAFNAVLQDGSLTAADMLLQGLSDVDQVVEHLIRAHDRNGFTRVEELFAAWEGADADAGAEQFGDLLRPAAGFHRMIAAQLIQGALAECAVKLAVHVNIGMMLKQVRDNIDALRTSTDPGLKIIVRTAFNTIKHSGPIVSLADGVGELAGSSSEAPVSDWLAAFFGNFDIEHEMALQPQNGSVLLQQLLNAAEQCKRILAGKRDEALPNLSSDHGSWAALVDNEPRILIPGEPNK